MTAQRRDNVRADAAVPVRVWRGEAGPIDTWALDVSGGGFRLAGPDVLHEGEEFGFALTIPGHRLEGRARVVHEADKDGIGCEFSELPFAHRELIVRYVFVRQREELRDLKVDEGSQ